MKTTFSRTFFPAAIVLLAALLLVGFSLRALVLDFLTDRSVEGLKNDAEAISSLASAYYTEGSLSGRDFLVNLSLASQVSGADAVIFSKSGELVLCSDAPLGCRHQGLIMNESYVQQVLSAGMAINTGTFPGLYEEARYIVSVPISDAFTGSSIGFVMVSSTMESSEIIIQRITDIYLMVSLLTVLAAGIIMTVYARKQSAPLREMADAAIAFGHGDLTARVKADDAYTQEIEELAIAFNNMATSLQKSEYQRREFVANVSHELKTPLQGIIGSTELLESGMVKPEDMPRFVGHIRREASRLVNLIEDIIRLSQLDEGVQLPAEQVDMLALAEDVKEILTPSAAEKNITIDVTGNGFSIQGVRRMLQEIIYNLCDNAIKYNVPSGSVTICAENNALVVSDTGIGIPAEHKDRIFERFYRVDKSHSKASGGTGLGLSIVKHAVQYHHGRIALESELNKGTTISVFFDTSA